MKTRKIFTLLIAITLVLGIITGCGNNDAKASDDDTLYLRLVSPLQSTDWQQVSNLDSNNITNIQVFEGFYGMDEVGGGYYDLLAKDIQVSDDGKEYTVTLVDATFQNGETLTAEDAVFSYNLAIANPKYGYVTSMIDKIEAKDPKTVVLTLKYPYAAIAHTFFTIKIISQKEYEEIEAAGETFGTKPHTAGTGPYYITEYDVSAGVKLAAYENYWKGAPAIKNVEYRVISDDAAAVIAFENGEIDYFANAPLAEWSNIEKSAGDRCDLAKANDITFLGINYKSKSNNSILANDKVREAIFYAINKENIVQSSTSGLGSVAYEYMVPEYVATSPKASDGEFATFDYDAEKCHQCLLDAGFTEDEIAKGINVGTILTYPSDNSPKGKAAVVIQDALKQNGMIANIEIREAAACSDDLYGQNYDLCIFSDSGNYDYNNIRQQLHSESVGLAVVNYKDDKGTFDWKYMEDLIDEGVSTTDPVERYKIYTKLWSYAMDTKTILPLYHSAVGIAWSDRINVAKINPTYYHLTDFSWNK